MNSWTDSPFFKALLQEDDLGAIIRGCTYVEYYLHRLISTRFEGTQGETASVRWRYIGLRRGSSYPSH